jgi:hypothetical protein
MDSEQITQEDVISELSQFTGTEAYYKASNLYDLHLTDGMHYLRLKLNCFWLIDIVGSVQYLDKIKKQSFIVWDIIKNKDNSFIVRAYWDYDSEKTRQENKQYLLYEQKGQFTDFLLNEFQFYQINNILLLKSEY